MTTISFNVSDFTSGKCPASHCVVLPLFKSGGPTPAAQSVDADLGGLIARTLKLGDFKGNKGDVCMIPGNTRIRRVLLLGCGDKNKLDRQGLSGLIDTACKQLSATSATNAHLHLGSLDLDRGEQEWLLSYAGRRLQESAYRYNRTLSKAPEPFRLRKVTVAAWSGMQARTASRLLTQGAAVGRGVNVARELADLPGNICTPVYLAGEARKMARGNARLTTSILDEKKMQELGMGALLSVSAGSAHPARLITMQYKGGKAQQKPYVFVGKGITFDSGGISIKPGQKMDEMKYDMGGAASVFGLMEAVVALDLPINVVCIVAAAENMPSGTATRPGDVVTSMSGRTIEILNTDAEGRLVLCDALTYAGRYKPEVVVDIATLTGACVVALGNHASGLYANRDEFAEELLAAGIASHDRAWHMPLWPEYQQQLKSEFADVANIGGPTAGSITAACFLARFAEEYKWAHLDVAGTAWSSAPKAATGRPVALLAQYLLGRSGR